MRMHTLSLSIMAMGIAAVSSQALASGYNFGSQSVSAQGTAHANAAEAADPSTIYYNPAGLGELEGTQVQFGVTDVQPRSTLSNERVTLPAYATQPTVSGASTTYSSGNSTSSYVPSSVVAPTFYLSHAVDSRLTLGLGVFVPYGAEVNYGTNWNGGQFALESISLKTLNINPSLAYKLDDHQTLGFGVSAQYMQAKLTEATDPVALLGVPAGEGSVSADGWGYGFNLGYLYKLDDHTRFGLAYRSEIHHTLKGDVAWTGGATANPGPGLVSSNAETKVTTPQSASASFYHELNSKVAVMGTATWTGHSSLDQIAITFPNTHEPPFVIQQKWKNAWMFALGANYKYSDALTLRTGVAYDQSPANAQYIYPGLPDGDRYMLSLGSNYKFDAHQSVDFSYSYIWVRNVNMNYTDVCAGAALGQCNNTNNGETISGSYRTRVQMIGLAYNYRF
ncbi:MAG: transporter [Paludibacterium sp.]|uniref:OmpP1/FadL family transporter n=1 Tax=Paludibacterium sp. TaxID=1917523 RepID=UPI0025F6F573|nr:OmpP1/FadL family transporter [Paludibacterium sp.]MBV8048116.1 transporter [Paludibacterium sp.]MBV8647012.1 transporter [Paludibacterium sp.]